MAIIPDLNKVPTMYLQNGLTKANVKSGSKTGLKDKHVSFTGYGMNSDEIVVFGDVRKLPKAIGISKLASHISLENIAAGICVNLAAAVLGAAGILSVTAAVIACFAVSAAVLINTLRLK